MTAAESHVTARRWHRKVSWQTRVVRGTSVLNPGQSVHTNRIRLTLQTDGDLVLRNEHNAVVWSTGTHAPDTHVVFQGDGNFVLYSNSNQTLWSSRTDGHIGATLVLQADGNVTIIYNGKALWATGTGR
ncbi:bulb-type lectin domain-containing protein [Actinoallomurus sp. NPDC050550]|uniref:bulb-type lectin domain-containing protein n=1 Tax=Actinoallomurus sp. NPDC050550 TaxID=3154937 RepID=UPI0033C0E9E3